MTNIGEIKDECNNARTDIVVGQRWAENLAKKNAKVATAVGAMLEHLEDAVDGGHTIQMSVKFMAQQPVEAAGIIERSNGILEGIADGDAEDSKLSEAITQGRLAISALLTGGEQGGNAAMTAAQQKFGQLMMLLYSAKDLANEIIADAGTGQENMEHAVTAMQASHDAVTAYVADK